MPKLTFFHFFLRFYLNYAPTVPQLCPNWFCFNCASTVPQVTLCPNCAPTVPQLCPRVFNFVPQMGPNCASIVPQLCPNWYCLNCAPSNCMPQLCPDCAPTVPGSFQFCAPTVPQLGPKCAPIVPSCITKLPNKLLQQKDKRHSKYKARNLKVPPSIISIFFELLLLQ